MRLNKAPGMYHQYDYSLTMTKEELLLIANDSMSDHHYTNELLGLIYKAADKIEEEVKDGSGA